MRCRRARNQAKRWQVVLLEDEGIREKKGQIVNVNDGYARNFILPKKLGVEATKNLSTKASEGQ